MDAVHVSLDDVDLEGVARETMAGAAEAVADKGLILKSECHGLQVRAHRDMLAAVLRNLVSNAVKFTLPRGTITVSAHRRGERVVVEVADTGVGMPPNKIDDLC